jgi:succinyl-diaminopimelate desuccinylase
MTSSAVALARDMVRIPSINPPGDETGPIKHMAGILEAAGFECSVHAFAPNRPSMVARLKGSGAGKPLAFTGHVDVVPLGAKPWSVEPFAGDIADGKLHGRGSSDMKAGIAAFVDAVTEISRKPLTRGITLVITAGEETGCEGAYHLAKVGALGEASLLIVAEPSSNETILAHKGSLRLAITASGKTAHSSMPELGDNAIYKAADWIRTLRGFTFDTGRHPLLGTSSIAVTTITGGLNINSIPDRAMFTVDFRTIPNESHNALIERVRQLLGAEADVVNLTDVPGFSTDPADPAVAPVQAAYERILGRKPVAVGAPYFTDASALTPAFGNVPTVVIGPGEMGQAHQTDEYCFVDRIDEARAIYADIIRSTCLA